MEMWCIILLGNPISPERSPKKSEKKKNKKKDEAELESNYSQRKAHEKEKSQANEGDFLNVVKNGSN